MQGLEGIRVVEFGGGVGLAYLSKLFADLGADVVRFETEDVERVRQRPHDVHRWLNANKRSVSVELERWVEGADLVLHDLGPTRAQTAGVEYAALSAHRSDIVVCSFTGFGSTGPYADYAAEEITTMHGSSWGFLSPSAADDPTLPPLKAPGHHSTIMVAHVAGAAALAAVDKAQRTGIGDHVDFSVFACSAKITETAPAGALFTGSDASRLGVKTVVPWGTYACADGMVQVICPEQVQWEGLLELMGNPDWADTGMFDDNNLRRDNADLVHLYLGEWFASQTVAEVYAAAQSVPLCLSPVNTMSQLADDPHYASRDFFRTTPGGTTVPGPGFVIDQPWWSLRSDAADIGQHNDEQWHPAAQSHWGGDASDGGGRPLEGIRVCDFTWVWAGPMCTQVLAHLGADVIRLESPEHPCLFRRLPFNPPELPLTPDTNGIFQTYNTDKRSLGIDLRHPDAVEVVRRLVAASDVVVENFAVGTMASLGLGVEDLRAMNPNVVVVSLSGYGQTGPSAHYMAYGPAGGAVGGLYSANGYPGGSPCETGVAVGDPGTGITAAWATVAALVARRRTGAVAYIDVAMVEAVAATVGELWMEFLETGTDPVPRGNRDGGYAPHGIFPSAGEDQWVSIACPDEASWDALCSVVPGLGEDERFVTVKGRLHHEDELSAFMSAWTRERDRWEVTRELQAVGVAAFPSLAPLELWTADPQLAARGMTGRPLHTVTGPRPVPGVPWLLDHSPNGLRRAAPCVAEHSDDVLETVLDFTTAEIDGLVARGAIIRPNLGG